VIPSLAIHPPRRPSRRPGRFFRITHRVADRMTPKVAAALSDAVLRLQGRIDVVALRAAVVGGNLSVIEGAAGSGQIQAILLGDPVLLHGLTRTTTLVGEEGASVLGQVTGLNSSFNRFHPNVVLYARTQVGNLVSQIGQDVKEAIRVVVALGAGVGLTPVQQARAIQEVIGLPPNWAQAPLHFAEELRNGQVNASRLLRTPVAGGGSTPQSLRYAEELRRGIAQGKHLSPEWVASQQSRYSKNLLRRRALNIARTETMRAAVAGQAESWSQAVRQGVLPRTARRFPIVTPDERLRPTHRAIPGMNLNGVRLTEPYRTPMGPLMHPPFGPLCRCGEALMFQHGGRRRFL